MQVMSLELERTNNLQHSIFLNWFNTDSAVREYLSPNEVEHTRKVGALARKTNSVGCWLLFSHSITLQQVASVERENEAWPNAITI